jgi:hypothetical protein
MWILLFLLSLINLLFIVHLVLIVFGWTTLNIQVPIINWLNSKFKIHTRYVITSETDTNNEKDEITKEECLINSETDTTDTEIEQNNINKISDDVETEKEDSETNNVEFKNKLIDRKSRILIDESLD